MAIDDICGWARNAGDWADYPRIESDQTADWVIIGAGFSGLAAARRISELYPDQRVMLVDGKLPGQGATARNSGFVVANESPGHAQLHTASGRESYMIRNKIDRAGVAELDSLVRRYSIDCDWDRCGSIHAAADPRNVDMIQHHHDSFNELGIESTLLDQNALSQRIGSQFYRSGIYCEGGALVQPAALVKGLLDALPEQVEVFAQSPVLSISPGSRSGVLVKLANAEIKAARVIVAVNAFLPRLGLAKNRVFPLALTASMTRPLNEREMYNMADVPPWGILSPRSLGATLRFTPDRRLLIRNTAEYFPAGINARQLAKRRLSHEWGLRRRFPWLEPDAIEYSWSGQICISSNSRPVFGELEKSVFASGCYNASGIAKGSMMGRLIVDYALGATSELLDAAGSIATPAWIPSRTFLAPLIKARLAYERFKSAAEA